MPKIKTTYAYKIQSMILEFPVEFMQNINNQLHCNYVTVRFLVTNAFLLILIEIRLNIKKRWAADLKILSPRLCKRF